MKCCRCGRPLSQPAATVKTRRGVAGYGPKCAQLMGLMTAATKTLRLRVSRPAARASAGQLDWIAEAAA